MLVKFEGLESPLGLMSLTSFVPAPVPSERQSS